MDFESHKAKLNFFQRNTLHNEILYFFLEKILHFFKLGKSFFHNQRYFCCKLKWKIMRVLRKISFLLNFVYNNRFYLKFQVIRYKVDINEK